MAKLDKNFSNQSCDLFLLFRLANQIQNNQSTESAKPWIQADRNAWHMADIHLQCRALFGQRSWSCIRQHLKLLDMITGNCHFTGVKMEWRWCWMWRKGQWKITYIYYTYYYIVLFLFAHIWFMCVLCIVYCIYIPYVFLCKYRNVMGTYCIAHYSYSIMTHEHACALHLDCW